MTFKWYIYSTDYKPLIKLSKMTDYAVVILGGMAGANGAQMTASSLSEKTGLPEPTVAKILKLLAKGKLVESARGINGGYRLVQKPERISMADVIAALEGPVALTACVDGGDECCSIAGNCSMKGKWNPVNAAMQQALANVTLAQMMEAQA
jgi:FeS assembly SUF system regulator